MKLVINKCYGGFGLSPQGEEAYLKRKGKTPFFYAKKSYQHGENEPEYKRVDAAEAAKVFYATTLLKDYGPYLAAIHDGMEFFSDKDIPRDDPDLVALVEQEGSEFMSGQWAELKVVEIPDDVEWQIDEYDGFEWVAEKHRVWR